MHTYLARQQDMLTCLWHRTICGRNNKNCSVHLSCTCNHIFNIVSVSGAIHVRVVAIFCLIFNMRSRDSNTSFLFLWRVINVIIVFQFCKTFSCQHSRNSCTQSCFTMINMPDCSHIYVRFVFHKLFFCHFVSPNFKI